MSSDVLRRAREAVESKRGTGPAKVFVPKKVGGSQSKPAEGETGNITTSEVEGAGKPVVCSPKVTPRGHKRPREEKKGELSSEDRGKKVAVPLVDDRLSEEELAARMKQGVIIGESRPKTPTPARFPPANEGLERGLVLECGGETAKEILAPGEGVAGVTSLSLKRALRSHEKSLGGLKFTPPLTLVRPAKFDKETTGLARGSGDVIQCRVSALVETVEGLQIQSDNQAVEIVNVRAEKEKVEVENAKLMKAKADLAEELSLLQKSKEDWVQEKKTLLNEKVLLAQSLSSTQAEVASLTDKLTEAENSEKVCRVGLRDAEDALADIYWVTFNNALEQIELRNSHQKVEFDGVHPSHEVEGDLIVKKERDGSKVVIWPPVELPATPFRGNIGEESTALPDTTELSQPGVVKEIPKVVISDDDDVAIGSLRA